MQKLLLIIVPFLWLTGCASAPPSTDLAKATVADLHQAQSDDQLSAEAIVQYYLKEISANNEAGVNLRAVISLNPNALEEAKALDEERRAQGLRGPLHGIPVLLKDNIDAKGMANTAGSVLLKENFPTTDAFVVQRLREAGAVIIGKANLSEWANFRSTRSSSGWSGMGGQALNPHDVTRSTCGSSAGSAAAVAAGFAPLAVGTETDGSLVCPAAVNGVVTIKPTLGLLSRSGIIPIAISQDTAGPMALTVADAAALLDAMQGADATDPDAYVSDTRFTDHLKTDGLRGKRIGVVRNLMGYHSPLDEVFEAQLKLLKDAGAILVEDANIDTYGDWGGDEYTVLLYEFKAGIADYLATNTDLEYRTLSDLIADNEAFADEELHVFGQEIFQQAEATDGITSETYVTAKENARRAAATDGIDATLAQYDVDLLIAPTTAPAWKIDQVNGDHFMGSASSPAAVAGYPHITVPMGTVKQLPVGISFFGGAKSEAILIEAAYGYEQASQARVAPQLGQIID